MRKISKNICIYMKYLIFTEVAKHVNAIECKPIIYGIGRCGSLVARPPARARPRSGLKGAATRPARAMDGAGRTYGVIDT